MVGVVLLIAAAAIVGGAVAMATGRGGEMAMFPRDVPAVQSALRTPADVAAVRLPLAVFGYQPEATAAVLSRVAKLLADRDAEIAMLRGAESHPGPADDSTLPAS